MPNHAQDNPASVIKPLFTIVTFGDSTTAPRNGVDVYTSQLEARLKSSSTPVCLMNRGVGGNTTAMARERFEEDVLSEKPNLVIIQFGINDAMVDVWKTPPAQTSRVSLENYIKNIRFFVQEICKSGGEVILMTPNPLRWSDILRGRYGKPPYDPTSEKGLNLILEKYAQGVRTVAEDLNVPIVDVDALYDAWEKAEGQSCGQLLADGSHPNTQGQTLVARALEPIVQDKITAFQVGVAEELSRLSKITTAE